MTAVVLRRKALFLLVIPLVLSAASSSPWIAEAGEVCEGTAVIDAAASIATTDENFICAALDWDLSNPILVNALKAFSTIRLRLGGTKQDAVRYETRDPGQPPCITFVTNDSALFGVNEGCLPLSRWDQLNEFFQKTSAQVIFGLNALNGRVPMQDGSLGGPWNHEKQSP
ncbi:Heparanase-like protein 3 [Platanthera zijinensis]|uniref:Heparanase-like protein 3 n=1 Tax=Platanthera zijinensis TaxID=2320716 RepID=A0AAP0B5R7_9ASPA